jgi:hypothetical protein
VVKLSTIVAETKHQFEALVGNTYYLYRRTDGTHFISMVEPEYWNHVELVHLTDVTYTKNNTWKIIKKRKK